jgi:tyrosine-protein phosphatase YwqE
MVDIHCHILPGLDDGAESVEISLEMAEAAIAEGITHVVGTPHANARFAFRPELVQQRRDEIQAKLGNRLVVGTGCDFHLSFENLKDAQKSPHKYTINHKQYLLVELGDFAIPPAMDETLHRLQLAGVSPIITHPRAQQPPPRKTRAPLPMAASRLLRSGHREFAAGTIRSRRGGVGGTVAQRGSHPLFSPAMPTT